MIETLVISNLNKSNTENFNEQDTNQLKNMFNNLSPVNVIVALVISLAAAYFAYHCNSHETKATQFIYTVIAFFFPGLYLIYYFIRHVIVGDKCGGRHLMMRKLKKGRSKGRGRKRK
jgi:hypothetical protein